MKAIDILTFDAVKQSEAGFEFELKHVDGMTGTGVYVTVLGKHADAVQSYLAAAVNKMVTEHEYAKRRGREVEPKTLEQVREDNRKSALIRVTGWRNVQQDYSAELMDKALQRNPHWIEQIIEKSDDLGNFSQK